VEVADGHVIKCTKTEKIRIRMLDDNGARIEITLMDVMYVPGLSRRLFSVAKECNNVIFSKQWERITRNPPECGRRKGTGSRPTRAKWQQQ
jgi:hypothetical protein